MVNVNAFEDLPPALLQRASMSFDGEDEATRLARRVRGWIANVAYRFGDT